MKKIYLFSIKFNGYTELYNGFKDLSDYLKKYNGNGDTDFNY